MTTNKQGVINIIHFTMPDNSVRHHRYWSERKLEGDESVRATFRAAGVWAIMQRCKDAVISIRLPGDESDLDRLGTEERTAHFCPLCMPNQEGETRE